MLHGLESDKLAMQSYQIQHLSRLSDVIFGLDWIGLDWIGLEVRLTFEMNQRESTRSSFVIECTKRTRSFTEGPIDAERRSVDPQ